MACACRNKSGSLKYTVVYPAAHAAQTGVSEKLYVSPVAANAEAKRVPGSYVRPPGS